MKLDFVAARSETIEGAQLRRVAVGGIAECEHRHTAEPRAELGEHGRVGGRALVRKGFA
jgi:hypothetical protein